MELRKMLRIQIRLPGNKKRDGKNIGQVILDQCRKESLLGATVTQCIFGFGEHEYRPHILRGINELPIIIELVDDPPIIKNLIPQLKEIVQDDGLITVEEVYAV